MLQSLSIFLTLHVYHGHSFNQPSSYYCIIYAFDDYLGWIQQSLYLARVYANMTNKNNGLSLSALVFGFYG